MEAQQEPVQELDITTPMGKISTKGIRISDILDIVILCGVVAGLYFSYQNTQVTSAHHVDTHSVNVEISNSIKESAKAQRMMACIVAMPQEKREHEFMNQGSFCRQVAIMP